MKPMELEKKDFFRPIDRQLPRFLARFEAEPAAEWSLAVALVSRSLGDGHVCLDLADLPDAYPAALAGQGVTCPEVGRWCEILRRHRTVGEAGALAPLILDGTRCYLHRYWQYERELARRLVRLAKPRELLTDEAVFRTDLARFFPPDASGEPDWIRVAAVMAATRGLCVISGGPGTGKTTALARILVLLLGQSPGLEIALAAPTGKAAARMNEAVRQVLARLSVPTEIQAHILESPSRTIHRLLGYQRHSPYFRHNAGHPLPADLVVVDEASMVDLALMSKLAAALRPDARLILLGDKDQLSAVEAGAFLGDLCRMGEENRYSPDFCRRFVRLTGDERLMDHVRSGTEPAGVLADCLVQFRRNWRFDAAGGIGRLGGQIRAGATDVGHPERSGESADVRWHVLPPPDDLKTALREAVLSGYAPVAAAADAESGLAALGEFRILCARREGPYGVAAVNTLVEEILAEAGLLNSRSLWYTHRPVMVVRNDYSLDLYNGDVGLVREVEPGLRRIFFPAAGSGIRPVLPQLLPAAETVYAMTVHKAQGSEFARVLLLLPDRDSPVLTRELLYTAVTRARESVIIFSRAPVFQAALKRRARRASGLPEALAAEAAAVIHPNPSPAHHQEMTDD
ncbi:MAG: exodeoxyribonuclease V subunit alpha [Acidobacteria bacterium]|nr:exodeoxyribonuclease V subunit alpha [Acidobacteriota bacterium]